MEPAIAKLPVLFGPNYTKSQEAKQLVSAGGGFKINNGTDFYNEIKSLFSNKEQLIKSSLSSKSVIAKTLGASKRVVEGILNVSSFNGLGTTSLLILVGVVLDISREMKSIIL